VNRLEMIVVIFLILKEKKSKVHLMQLLIDAIVNDIFSSYPKEKNKVFNRIRHEWK
jgi:hypothetical protein